MKTFKMNILKSVPIVILLVGVLSCDRDEVFEREQYKNVFALISETDNVHTRFHDLRDQESTGYLSASCGGTNPTMEDIQASIVIDPSLVDNFNKINYDLDYDQYAHELAVSNYTVDSPVLTIPAGEIRGVLPIRIRPEGLSPDSLYLIPLKVNEYDNYEVNPEKNYVLYRVRIKNFYAKDYGATSYNLSGSQNGINVFGAKNMHPIAANKVRIMAGTETYLPDIDILNRSAIVLEIDEDDNVQILPYGNIIVAQVDGDPEYPNSFKVEFDGYRYFKTFLLRYNYTLNGTAYEMKEELRYNFNPKDENEL